MATVEIPGKIVSYLWKRNVKPEFETVELRWYGIGLLVSYWF